MVELRFFNLSGTTQMTLFVTGGSFAINGHDSSRRASIAIYEDGSQSKLSLNVSENSPNSYIGLLPAVGVFGITSPLFLFGSSQVDSLKTGHSTLSYIVADNAFASIVIPGVVGGDPLSLTFENQTQIVQPGTTFNFLSLFPTGVSSLSLEGVGLSANTETGFTFAHNGLVDISLTTEFDIGNYNSDSSIDAADYVMWRKGDGSETGYNLWRANFGAGLPSGSPGLASAAVPEPSTVGLLTFVATCGIAMTHRR